MSVLNILDQAKKGVPFCCTDWRGSYREDPSPSQQCSKSWQKSEVAMQAESVIDVALSIDEQSDEAQKPMNLPGQVSDHGKYPNLLSDCRQARTVEEGTRGDH